LKVVDDNKKNFCCALAAPVEASAIAPAKVNVAIVCCMAFPI